jgi:hypothetical protein
MFAYESTKPAFYRAGFFYAFNTGSRYKWLRRLRRNPFRVPHLWQQKILVTTNKKSATSSN